MILTIILIIISASAFSVMWTLEFHFSKSIFRNLDRNYWNPQYSWTRKYKSICNLSDLTPRFWGSTTIFVWLTDALHLFQFIFLNTLSLSFAITANWYEWLLVKK